MAEKNLSRIFLPHLGIESSESHFAGSLASTSPPDGLSAGSVSVALDYSPSRSRETDVSPQLGFRSPLVLPWLRLIATQKI